MIHSKADSLIIKINLAFKNIQLGEGVGLGEAQGLDDYLSKQQRQKLRLNDEKENWQKITVNQLNKCSSNLCFFDPLGMRFHLPAYMIAEIKKQYHFDLLFHLTYFTDYTRDQFSKLNSEQRGAVRLFLEYLIEDKDYEFDIAEIEKSIIEFWS